jgi:ADP-dependent phosphofructokinase/glucokinase
MSESTDKFLNEPYLYKILECIDKNSRLIDMYRVNEEHIEYYEKELNELGPEDTKARENIESIIEFYRNTNHEIKLEAMAVLNTQHRIFKSELKRLNLSIKDATYTISSSNGEVLKGALANGLHMLSPLEDRIRLFKYVPLKDRSKSMIPRYPLRRIK